MFEFIKKRFKKEECGHGNDWLEHYVDESTFSQTSGSGEIGTCERCGRTDIKRPEPS